MDADSRPGLVDPGADDAVERNVALGHVVRTLRDVELQQPSERKHVEQHRHRAVGEPVARESETSQPGRRQEAGDEGGIQVVQLPPAEPEPRSSLAAQLCRRERHTRDLRHQNVSNRSPASRTMRSAVTCTALEPPESLPGRVASVLPSARAPVTVTWLRANERNWRLDAASLPRLRNTAAGFDDQPPPTDQCTWMLALALPAPPASEITFRSSRSDRSEHVFSIPACTRASAQIHARIEMLRVLCTRTTCGGETLVPDRAARKVQNAAVRPAFHDSLAQPERAAIAEPAGSREGDDPAAGADALQHLDLRERVLQLVHVPHRPRVALGLLLDVLPELAAALHLLLRLGEEPHALEAEPVAEAPLSTCRAR